MQSSRELPDAAWAKAVLVNELSGIADFSEIVTVG